jgi:hypothetical protein
MGAEYALEYPDDNPVMDAIAEYEKKWGELPKGPTPDEVRACMKDVIKRYREAEVKRPVDPTLITEVKKWLEDYKHVNSRSTGLVRALLRELRVELWK